MSKLLLTSIAVFLNTLVAFSQSLQENVEKAKYDHKSIDSTSNYLLYKRIESTHLIFPKLKIPIEGLTRSNFNMNTANTFPFGKGVTFHNNYNYLQQSETTRNQYLLHDFSGMRSDKIFNVLFLNTSSQKSIVLGCGEYFQVNETIRWTPNSRFGFDVGGFYSRQYSFFSGSRSDIVGINTQTCYSLSNRIQFKVWGQYVTPFKQNSFKGNPFFQNSNTGSSFLFNLNNQMKLDMGVKYRYYENKMNWNIESVSKISIGF